MSLLPGRFTRRPRRFWQLAGLFLAVCTLAGCGVPIEPPPATNALPVTVEPLPTMTIPTLAPTSARSPLPPEPTLTKPVTGTPLTPALSAPALRFGAWSADGAWLAYWTSTPEDLAGDFYPQPPARLAILNALTGQACTHDQMIAESVADRVAWQPDGRLLVEVGGQAYLGLPCSAEFQPVEAPVVEEDPALSPGGDYRAETTVQSSTVGIQTLRTDLLALPDRQVILSAEWQIDERLGELGLGGEWLGGNQFLIYETLDRGPLLLTVSGETLPVAGDLFGVDDIPSMLDPEGVSLRAAGRSLQDSLDYHLVLYGVGAEANFPPVRLYHSETGTVEEMPFTHLWSPAFSADGRWLLLDERPVQDGYETYALWIRAIDPPGSSVRLFSGGFPAAWSPAWDRAAFAGEGTVTVLAFPGGQALGAWELDDYEAANFLWSPDGSSLAVLAAIPGQPEMSLFLIKPEN